MNQTIRKLMVKTVIKYVNITEIYWIYIIKRFFFFFLCFRLSLTPINPIKRYYGTNNNNEIIEFSLYLFLSLFYFILQSLIYSG